MRAGPTDLGVCHSICSRVHAHSPCWPHIHLSPDLMSPVSHDPNACCNILALDAVHTGSQGFIFHYGASTHCCHLMMTLGQNCTLTLADLRMTTGRVSRRPAMSIYTGLLYLAHLWPLPPPAVPGASVGAEAFPSSWLRGCSALRMIDAT